MNGFAQPPERGLIPAPTSKTSENERSFGRCTTKAERYMAARSSELSASGNVEISRRTIQLVRQHDEWRSNSISLNAAENVLSVKARQLLNSDLATRVTEGFPGDKDFPADLQNRFVDEIEATVIFMLRRMFAAKHVEWRPVSTSMALATLFFALTEPGDLILVQPENAGGNYSYNAHGPPRAAKLQVVALPFNSASFEIDMPKARHEILTSRPKLIIIGGSNVLFPYPVRELRAAADEVGATLIYDAAHTALFAATGHFQNPLMEGAHVLTFSSHKIMCGPVGGLILTNDDDLASQIQEYSFPTLIQTRDQNKYAASAQALAEMAAFGADYARQIILNARALAQALESEGFGVLWQSRNYTSTHQIFMLLDPSEGSHFEDSCQRANLLVTRAQRMGNLNQPAVRLSSQEVTRRGMTEVHMENIAKWLRRAIRDRDDPNVIATEIASFLREFQTIKYSFDEDVSL